MQLLQYQGHERLGCESTVPAAGASWLYWIAVAGMNVKSQAPKEGVWPTPALLAVGADWLGGNRY